eukprot:TRINITY_DN65108_c0_g1_i1.p1 TRINITY_DN65108_c0_g1~~TRINITY_DN65108_c0_g1_i1.p1  ORF type:complete len:643 (+),score=124.22 TRINITY_DN65108_c0_g1_i1:87-2015(+)
MGEESPDPPAGQGITVFGAWLGFGVVNVVLPMLVAVSGLVAWQLSFTICLFYALFVVAMALNLEHSYGQKTAEVVNALWVVACLTILALGTYLSVFAVGPWPEEEGWKPRATGDLASLLPAESPARLADWARGEAENVSDSTMFDDSVYFTSRESQGVGDTMLWHSDLRLTDKPAAPVLPGLADARGFIEFGDRLYFSARSNGSTSEADGLWYVDRIAPGGRGASRSAVSLKTFDAETRIKDFAVLNESSFYFKVFRICSGLKGHSLFQSDGTASGTVDLDLSADCSVTALAQGDQRPPTDRLIGELLLAVLPQTFLACGLLVFKKMPGMILNIYGGSYATALLIYLLACRDVVDLHKFIVISLTIYASVGYVAVLALHCMRPRARGFLRRYKTWSVLAVSSTFFGVIALALDVPFTAEVWKWAVYGVLQLLQVVIGLIMFKRLPVLFGLCGLLVVVCRIALEIVAAFATGVGLGSTATLMAQRAALAFIVVVPLLIAVLSSDVVHKVEEAQAAPKPGEDPQDGEAAADAASTPAAEPEPAKPKVKIDATADRSLPGATETLPGSYPAAKDTAERTTEEESAGGPPAVSQAQEPVMALQQDHLQQLQFLQSSEKFRKQVEETEANDDLGLEDESVASEESEC